MYPALRAAGCALAVAILSHASVAAENPAAAQEPAADAQQDAQQRFRLEFHNQPWLPALQWFAEKSNLNLDWQTLPEGEFNLSAQRPYTVEEIRDVLNMQLLVRGFTLLERGDVLRVVPLENLDPTLVTRVQPEELETLPSHQFVRVSFPLEWMVADDAARELGALLSPYGKLIPLAATNHLEAMDAVVNLREIKHLLDREQSDSGRGRLVEEFVLEHRRAYDVADMLRQLLGLQETRYRRSSDVMRMQLERTKLQSQAVKELGENATRFLKDDPEVNLVVNEEENSILVHAPPDKVEVIRQAVKTLDRPSAKEDSVWENINRVKVYKVTNVDVDAIEDMIRQMQELGRLSPETRIEQDDRNDTLIAYATPTDHMTLAHLVRSFQQEPREAHVLQLGVLEPRYAAQAVRVLFNQNDDDDDDWRRRRYGGSEESQFRVEADTQNRRLLLWATSTERSRVEDYLKELGEVGSSVAGRQKMKVLQAGGADLSELESKLRDVWGSVSTAPLVIQSLPGPDGETPPAEDAEPEIRQSSSPEPAEKSTSENDFIRTASILQVASHDTEEECAVDEQEQEDAAEATDETTENESGAAGSPDDTQEAQNARPPVRVLAGPDGRLIVTSDDPAAAQLMSQLLESLLPEEKDVHVFPLRYASALSIEFQVQDLLNVSSSEYEDDPFGSQPELVVYSDGRTNSLLVRNATSEQLESIQNLIEILDRPEKVEPDLARQQRIYRVRNKDATELAETIKEVYRDLLSSTDKAFAGGGDDRGRIQGYWGFASARSTVPEYQGLLSVGVDAASNSVVVSAPKYLMDEVMELAKSLDDQASAQAVSVVRLQSGMNSTAVRETLSEMLGQSGGGGDRRRGRR
jgi:type II secretory pathway component GspD/PulD (secretin)